MLDGLSLRVEHGGLELDDDGRFHIPKARESIRVTAVRDMQTLFADYAEYHRTPGNKWFHRFGIPMIMLSLLGLLARVPIIMPVDAAIALIAIAAVIYLRLDWRLGAMMIAVSVAFYLFGRALPLPINGALFVLGWVLQFVGHSVYEHRRPAFLKNALHLLVGPLWILNDAMPRKLNREATS